jgi:hypothetical protein
MKLGEWLFEGPLGQWTGVAVGALLYAVFGWLTGWQWYGVGAFTVIWLMALAGVSAGDTSGDGSLGVFMLGAMIMAGLSAGAVVASAARLIKM